jgi:hypothetical protein
MYSFRGYVVKEKHGHRVARMKDDKTFEWWWDLSSPHQFPNRGVAEKVASEMGGELRVRIIEERPAHDVRRVRDEITGREWETDNICYAVAHRVDHLTGEEMHATRIDRPTEGLQPWARTEESAERWAPVVLLP